MLEQLDYLIRALTYKRSCLECDLGKIPDGIKMEFTNGQINGLSIAISELYRMVGELIKDDE